MTDSALIGGGGCSQTTSNAPAAVTWHGPWHGVGYKDANATPEGNAQVANRGSSTLLNAYLNVSANTKAASSTITSRVNTAGGNISITIGAGATGDMSDTTHSDSMVDGDLFNYRLTTTGAGSTLGVRYVMAQMDRSGQAAVQVGNWANGVSINQVSSTRFGGFGGGGTNASVSTTESDRQIPALDSTTLSNMQFTTPSNARINTTTFLSRVNAGNGNQTFGVGAGATGLFEDTTHTDSLVSGDQYNLQYTTGSGNAILVWWSMSVRYLGTTSGNSVVNSGCSSSAGTNSAIRMWPIGGAHATTATGTEANTQTIAALNGAFTKLNVRVITNTSSNTETAVFRKNAATGNQSIAIGSSSTGLFADTTHSDAVVVTDKVDWAVNGSATAASISFCMSTVMFGTSGTTVTLDVFTPAEWGAALSADDLPTPIEFGALLQAQGPGPVEFEARLQADTGSRSDSGSGLQGGAPGVLEISSVITGGLASPLTWLAQLQADSPGRVEWGSALQADVVTRIEWGQVVTGAGTAPLEFGRTQAGDTTAPIEWGGAQVVNMDGRAPIEWGALIQSDATGRAEWGAGLAGATTGRLEFGSGVAAQSGAPVEAGSGLAADTRTPVEWLGTTLLTLDARAPLEWGASVQADSVGREESGSSLSGNSGAPLELGSALAQGTTGRIETGTGVASETRGPVTWLAGLAADIKALVEWGGTIPVVRRVMIMFASSANR